jgi:hypothetical protein
MFHVKHSFEECAKENPGDPNVPRGTFGKHYRRTGVVVWAGHKTLYNHASGVFHRDLPEIIF